MSKKSQLGIVLIWVIFAGALFITEVKMTTLTKSRHSWRGDELHYTIEFQRDCFPLEQSRSYMSYRQMGDSKQQKLFYVAEARKPSYKWRGRFTPFFRTKKQGRTSQEPPRDNELLEILPPKERGDLKSAIREAQEVLKDTRIYVPPTIDDIKKSLKGLDKINKQTTEQLKKDVQKYQQEYQQKYQVDPKKIEEHFKQNPPAIPPGDGLKTKTRKNQKFKEV